MSTTCATLYASGRAAYESGDRKKARAIFEQYRREYVLTGTTTVPPSVDRHLYHLAYTYKPNTSYAETGEGVKEILSVSMGAAKDEKYHELWLKWKQDHNLKY
jgi:hypothetical protein